MGKRKLSEKMTVNAAARFLGVHPAEMQAYIDAGRIISTDGCISRLLLEDIRERQEKYISLRDYLKGHDGGLFDSRLVRNREKYIDFLEGHGYFGIQTIDPEAFILKASEKEGCFIAKEDLSFLDYKSQDFFAEFGLSEQEKTDRIISVVSGHDHTKDCVAGYLNHIHDEGNIYTPSLTDFARIVLDCQISYMLLMKTFLTEWKARQQERQGNFSQVFSRMLLPAKVYLTIVWG